MTESAYIQQARRMIRDFKTAKPWRKFAALVMKQYGKPRMNRRDKRIFMQFVTLVRQ